MKSFFQKINELNLENVYPFHMPGHKRRMKGCMDNAYAVDITEIDGYDNLHKPSGMIAELENRIRLLYGAGESYVLVNGSTCGILVALSAVTDYGDRVLMARNSHKSAYNAVCIRGLNADYVYPAYIDTPGMNGGISPEQIRSAFQKNGAIYKAVYITSPTYEGIVSNISDIAKIAHEYGAVLIVDEAHGAHFGFGTNFPESAVRCGADLVIQSIHKTLMGMTQTALLHVGCGADRRIDMDKLKYYLQVYQSSSPSYVLMASVDECIRILEKDKQITAGNGTGIFERYYEKLKDIYDFCGKLNDIRLFAPDIAYKEHCNKQIPTDDGQENVDRGHIFDFDCGKLVIFSESGQISGREIYDILRNDYKLQPEMSMEGYCLAMTSCMDSDEGYMRLKAALSKIDKKLVMGAAGQDKGKLPGNRVPGQQHGQAYCTIARAFEAVKTEEELREGLVAGEYGYVYPPGIPFIVPGERVTNEIICDIINCRAAGYEVNGITQRDGRLYMKVLAGVVCVQD